MVCVVAEQGAEGGLVFVSNSVYHSRLKCLQYITKKLAPHHRIE